MTTQSELLGAGWRFPFEIARPRGPARAAGLEHVEASIRQIVGTPVGSRVMRRDFGSRLREVVFAPNDAAVDTLVEHYVREALERWERRIEVMRVSVRHDERRLGRVEIGVEYHLRATRQPGTVRLEAELAGGGQEAS